MSSEAEQNNVVGGPSLDEVLLENDTGNYATNNNIKNPCISSLPMGREIRTLSKPHEEYQYLDAIRAVIETGTSKLDRTGTGTLSKFGMQFRYSLTDGQFPLFTTKRVFFRGVVEELLWFIRGSTNSKELSERGVKIWDANGNRQFLDSIGLTHRKEGDLGPVYGFQWRHFGARYENMHADYTGKGVDQLQQVIDRLQKNPNDRRAVVCAWNAPDLPEMALPPCHILFQFYVADERKLSCQMYQRSADMGLGVPFNVASYALLTCMVARVLDLEPYEFIHTLGDAHVYRDHVEPLQLQLQRTPRPFPTLNIKTPNRQSGDKQLSIDDFVAEDFELLNYSPHPAIPMKMSA